MKYLLSSLLILALAAVAFPAIAAASVCYPANGCTGISTVPSYGQVLVGNSGGTYTLTATSSLGIASGSGTVTSVTAGSGLSGGTFTTSGTISLNLANANSWTGLQQFTNATSTLFTSTTAWIGTLNLTNPLAIAQGGTGLTSTSQNFFFAGPTSGSGAPSWRAIVAGDIPTLNQNTTGSAATLTTARTINGVSFNGSANIVVASTTLLGDKNTFSLLQTLVAASSTNFSTTNEWLTGPSASSILALDNNNNVVATTSIGFGLIKGPASSIFAFNASGVPIATTSIGVNYLTGTLPIANGGTGQASQQAALNALMPTSPSAGELAYYNGSNWVGLAGNVSGTQDLQETSSGVPSWAAAGGSGTVTSVAATVPSVLSISGSPVTTSGTLTIGYSGTALPIANGGTAETSFGTSNGIVAYNGTGLVNFSAFTLTSSLLTASNASTTNLSVNGNEVSGQRYLTLLDSTSTTWTATSSNASVIAPFNGTLSTMQCSTATTTTDTSTDKLDIQIVINGSNVLPMIGASTTKGTITFTSNTTFSVGNIIQMQAGTPTNSPIRVTCTGIASGY